MVRYGKLRKVGRWWNFYSEETGSTTTDKDNSGLIMILDKLSSTGWQLACHDGEYYILKKEG